VIKFPLEAAQSKDGSSLSIIDATGQTIATVNPDLPEACQRTVQKVLVEATNKHVARRNSQ
jgi:hypothetical protein